MSKCDICENKPTEMTHCHLCLIREILTFKAENEQLQTENKRHQWIPVAQSPPDEPRMHKYIVRVEWEYNWKENQYTWEETYWWNGKWEKWDSGNTKVTHYMDIILPEQDLKGGGK